MEAYENMLESWMELVNKLKDACVDSLKPKAIEVFNSYIQCHISGPEGTRTQVQRTEKKMNNLPLIGFYKSST